MSTTFLRAAAAGSHVKVAPGIHVLDLGLGPVTGGAYTLQRVHLEPEGARVEALHRHDEGFSLAYVLSGWLDVEFEAIGMQLLGPRTVVPAFNGPVHRERDCGDHLELLLLVTQRSMSDSVARRIIVQHPEAAPARAGAPAGYRWRDCELETPSGGRLHAYEALAEGSDYRPQRHGVAASHLAVIYVVADWLEADFPDLGRRRLEAGTVVCVPPGGAWTETARGDTAVAVVMSLPV